MSVCVTKFFSWRGRVDGLARRLNDSAFEYRVSMFDFRLSGFGFRISGFGFWVHVSEIRFRVSGLGFGCIDQNWQKKGRTRRRESTSPKSNYFLEVPTSWK